MLTWFHPCSSAATALLMWPLTGPSGAGYRVAAAKRSPAGSQVVFAAVNTWGAFSRRPPVSDAVPRVLVLVVA